MLHPFRVYRELSEAQRPLSSLLARIALLMLALGTFVSFAAAGRLVLFHVASPWLAWAYLPVLQSIAIVASTRVVAPRAPIVRVLSLYFAGHAPWLLFVALLSAVVLFSSDVAAALIWLLSHGVVFALLGVTLVWSGVLTFACLRSGLSLSRSRAALGTTLHYVLYFGVWTSYYLIVGQLQPLFQR